MSYVTRSMATRSTALKQVRPPSPVQELPKLSRGRKPKAKQRDDSPSELPVVSTNTAPQSLIPRSEKGRTKKLTKSRAPQPTISSSDEEDNVKDVPPPQHNFEPPKSRPLRPKRTKAPSLPVEPKESEKPPSSSVKKAASKKPSKSHEESSGDEIGRLTRASARGKGKKVIPEEIVEEPVPVSKTVKRNASKRVLEQKNEIQEESTKSPKAPVRPPKVATSKAKKAPVAIIDESEDENEDNLFEKVIVEVSKTGSQKGGSKSKSKKKATQIVEAIEKAESQPSNNEGRALRRKKESRNLINELKIDPGVFASQIRVIAAVLTEPSAVRSMNYQMVAWEKSRNETTQEANEIMKQFKAEVESEKSVKKKGKKATVLAVVPEDGEKEMSQSNPIPQIDTRRSEKLFSSPPPAISDIGSSPPSKVVKRSTEKADSKKSSLTSITTAAYVDLEETVPEIVETFSPPENNSSLKSDCNIRQSLEDKQKTGTVKRCRSNEELEPAAKKNSSNFDFKESYEQQEQPQHQSNAMKRYLTNADVAVQFCPITHSLGPLSLKSKSPPVSAADETFVTFKASTTNEKPTTVLNHTFVKDGQTDPNTSSADLFDDDDDPVRPSNVSARSADLFDDDDPVHLSSVLDRDIFEESIEGNGIDLEEETESIFEKSIYSNKTEKVQLPIAPIIKETVLKKPCFNETVCISSPKTASENLPLIPESVPWQSSVSVLEIVEEEEEAAGITAKPTTNEAKERTQPRAAGTSSSSCSSTTSSSSFKSAVSQPVEGYNKGLYKILPPTSAAKSTEAAKKAFNLKKALEKREEEAQRKKAELLQQKQDLQKKKNDEWKKKADKIKEDEELKKAHKNQGSAAKPKGPVVKLPAKLLFPAPHLFSAQAMEPPRFKPSGPMKYKSPQSSAPRPLFNLAPPVLRATPGTPIRFGTPPCISLDVTADMTINSYDITVYEDLDEELRHRENKHVPEWAENKKGVTGSLFAMVPFRDVRIAICQFPKVQRGFKLYGSLRKN